jgi:CRISPR system Cascade subunit CasE
MTALHLVSMTVEGPSLVRFASNQGLLKYRDDAQGYATHAWLAAMFGAYAPQPFRFFGRRNQILGYATADAATLTSYASTYAEPAAWAALRPDSLASKPMRQDWRVGERLQADVLVCPVSRKDGHEKDVFLRAIDRLGDQVSPRPEVYRQWMERQWGQAIDQERIELTGMGRTRILRRTQRLQATIGRAVREMDRPFAEFRTVFNVRDPAAFQALLARGIGRHRAFGFGMLLLSPPS